MMAFFNSLLSVTAGASVLILLVLVLSAVIGKRYSTKWRYFAWLFIALRLMIPFEVPLNVSFFTFSVPEESTYATFTPEQNVTTPDKIVIEPDNNTQNVIQTPTNPTPVTPPVSVTPSGNDNIIIPSVPVEDEVEVNPVKTISYTAIFSVVWIVGVLLCLVMYTISHVRFIGNIRLWNRPVTEPWAIEIFKNVKQEMGMTKDIQLYRNRSVHSPILAGFFKPMVLIPTRNLTENDLYMVLRHELLHYKRHDLWYKLVLVLTGCLHWFNPLVWFMVKRADRDLEIACDEAVVKGTSMEFRRDYCDTILRIVRCDRGRKPALSTGFTTGKKTMKKRFACALDFTKKRTGIVLLCFVLCAAILCSTFIACEVTKKDLTKYYDDVLYFAERIPQTFANASDLSNDFVSGYLFNTITSKNEYKEDETGAVYIKQSEINETAKFLLGMETFVPDRELWMYHAENDNYAFYPAGEGPMYSGEITSSEEKEGVLYFTVKLTQKIYGSEDEEGYIPPKVYVITYAFTENDNDLYPLKAVKAEYDAEYLASIDVKGIGVLGYVDNAVTLPKHAETLSEKISDVNSFMFKKLRICAYDAAKNGYVVHYYDYTEGDDALNLALAVESIVKGSGLKVNSARVDKSFVVVDLVPTGEAVDNIKVKELLESIACTNDTNGYYLTGFTLSGGQFDFGGITLENDGYGLYEFEPLFNQPITTAELSAMRNLLIYPFTDDIGIPMYGKNTVAFADGVTDKNEELASLIYHAAGSGEYASFSQLSDEDKASVAISMIPDTYDCMTVPEKWSEVVVNADDYIYLKPLMTVVSDFEFVTKEWVELAVKQIWGEDAEITHPNTAKPNWIYRSDAGVYTPPHMGVGNDVLPYIHSVTKTADGYVAEVSYVTADMGGVHGLDTNETLETYDLFDNKEVVELAKRQDKYLVTAKYGDNGKLYLVSCVKKDLFNSITSEDVENAIANPDKFTEEELAYYKSILDPYEHSIGVSGEVSWSDTLNIVRKLVKYYEISPDGFAAFYDKVQKQEAEAVKVSGNLIFVPADVVEGAIAKRFNIDKEAFRNEAWHLDEYEYGEQAYAFNADMGYGGFYDYSILKVEKSGNIWKFYCSNSYPVYYGNEETYEEDYAVIVVEHKGENDYKFLCAKGFHEDKFASIRAEFVYPFSNGVPECEEGYVGLDESILYENYNTELVSLIYYAGRANKSGYNGTYFLGDEDMASAAISMLRDTVYSSEYSEFWGDSEDKLMILNHINEGEFIPKEWVEKAIKQIWGEDVSINHQDSFDWVYNKDVGVYVPLGMMTNYIHPYIHSITKTENGYIAQVSYVYSNGDIWGDAKGHEYSVGAVDNTNMFATPEVVELAKEQMIYEVTAEYGEDGKLYLVSSIAKTN